MSIGPTRRPDPDDYFSDTRMSFGDHLEDLRVHLWRAITGFMVAMVIGFIVGRSVLQFISAPVEAELQKYWDEFYKEKLNKVTLEAEQNGPDTAETFDFPVVADEQTLKELAQALGIKDIKDVHGPALLPFKIVKPKVFAAQLKQLEKDVGPRPSLIALNVQEGILVYIEVSMVAGFILSSPWIFYQIWSFIAAGLYPQEKRYVNVFLPFSIGLFLLGAAVCQFLVMPRAVGALLWFNRWLDLEPQFRLNEWLSFAILMPLVFGLSFQTPLVMLFLERIGLLTVSSYRSKRGIAWFLMALFTCILLPTVDVQSMLMMWIPMGLLYELGIYLCVLWPKRAAFDLEPSESDDLIEV